MARFIIAKMLLAWLVMYHLSGDGGAMPLNRYLDYINLTESGGGEGNSSEMVGTEENWDNTEFYLKLHQVSLTKKLVPSYRAKLDKWLKMRPIEKNGLKKRPKTDEEKFYQNPYWKYGGHITVAVLSSAIFAIVFIRKMKKLWDETWNSRPIAPIHMPSIPKQRVAPIPSPSSNLVEVVFLDKPNFCVYSEKTNFDRILEQNFSSVMVDQKKLNWPFRIERFAEVTVLSAGVSNLQEIILKCTPFQLVSMINWITTVWEEVLAKYDACSVMVTEGFLAISGAPAPNGTEHRRQMARVALELQRLIQMKSFTQIVGWNGLRIGIHSGPAKLCWFGMRHRNFCLTGKVVSQAAQLEATAKGNMIQISKSYFEKVDAYNSFRMSYNTEVYLKGRGFETTYLLEAEHLQLFDGKVVMVRGMNVYQATQVPNTFAGHHTLVKRFIEPTLPLPAGLELIPI